MMRLGHVVRLALIATAWVLLTTATVEGKNAKAPRADEIHMGGLAR